MLKVGPLTIGREERRWLPKALDSAHFHGAMPHAHGWGRWPHLHLSGFRPHVHGFAPHVHFGGDLPHWHVDDVTGRVKEMADTSFVRGWARRLAPYAAVFAAGAAVAYVLDPHGGRRRRALARDRVFGVAHRTRRRVGRATRSGGQVSYALVQRLMHAPFGTPRPVDDTTLVDRVKAALHRADDVPVGRISVNAVDGCVQLRGQVDRYDQIDAIEAVVRAVSGVDEVDNLLHMPGTPAPNKIASIDAHGVG
jgi:hypothetical protein